MFKDYIVNCDTHTFPLHICDKEHHRTHAWLFSSVCTYVSVPLASQAGYPWACLYTVHILESSSVSSDIDKLTYHQAYVHCKHIIRQLIFENNRLYIDKRLITKVSSKISMKKLRKKFHITVWYTLKFVGWVFTVLIVK